MVVLVRLCVNEGTRPGARTTQPQSTRTDHTLPLAYTTMAMYVRLKSYSKMPSSSYHCDATPASMYVFLVLLFCSVLTYVCVQSCEQKGGSPCKKQWSFGDCSVRARYSRWRTLLYSPFTRQKDWYVIEALVCTCARVLLML